jgi:hypothetical protein
VKRSRRPSAEPVRLPPTLTPADRGQALPGGYPFRKTTA